MLGIVLAAGTGSRLGDLTQDRAKPTLPTAEGPLVSWALRRLSPYTGRSVVTVGWLGQTIIPLLPDALVSDQAGEAFGTTRGLLQALGRADWDGAEAVMITSSDTIYLGSLDQFVSGWAGDRVRLLAVASSGHDDFMSGVRFTGTALIPGERLHELGADNGDIVHDLYTPSLESGEAELVLGSGRFYDCGTPYEYWLAIMTTTAGGGLIERGASLRGEARRCVVLSGASVPSGVHVTDAIVFSGGAIRVHGGGFVPQRLIFEAPMQ